MLWVAFELLENLHCLGLCDGLGLQAGILASTPGHFASLGSGGGAKDSWAQISDVSGVPASTVNVTHIFSLLNISQRSSYFCCKLSLSVLHIPYPLPRLAFPAVPCFRW